MNEQAQLKRCGKCSEVMPLNRFKKCKDCRHGVSNTCKRCTNQIEKSRRARDPQKSMKDSARNSRYESKNPQVKAIYAQLKRLAGGLSTAGKEVRPQQIWRTYFEQFAGTKVCSRCRQEKPIGAFYRHATPRCVQCLAENWRANAPSILRRQRQNQASNRAVLTDAYVRSLLKNHTHGALRFIPEQLVFAKRIQILIERHLRQLSNLN